MKTSKVILNMNTLLKKAVMKKTKEDGWTLSAFLNFAAREYVSGNLKATALDRDLEEAREEIRKGRYITLEEYENKLDAKLRKAHKK